MRQLSVLILSGNPDAIQSGKIPIWDTYSHEYSCGLSYEGQTKINRPVIVAFLSDCNHMWKHVFPCIAMSHCLGSDAAKEESGGDSFTEKLVAQVVKNLQVICPWTITREE